MLHCLNCKAALDALSDMAAVGVASSEVGPLTLPAGIPFIVPKLTSELVSFFIISPSTQKIVVNGKAVFVIKDLPAELAVLEPGIAITVVPTAICTMCYIVGTPLVKLSATMSFWDEYVYKLSFVTDAGTRVTRICR